MLALTSSQVALPPRPVPLQAPHCPPALSDQPPLQCHQVWVLLALPELVVEQVPAGLVPALDLGQLQDHVVVVFQLLPVSVVETLELQV